MTDFHQRAFAYKQNISTSGISIYDPITVGDEKLWIPNRELEYLLNDQLQGSMRLSGLKIRTRSKMFKGMVCEALGYPIPTTFPRTQPRFPGQNLDVYVQKSNNLQIWNQNVSPLRRYAIASLSADDSIATIKVVSGEVLALLDSSGTLTHKFQARLELGETPVELVSPLDTDNVQAFLSVDPKPVAFLDEAIAAPTRFTLLPIAEVHERLRHLVGIHLDDAANDQERRRGAKLHMLVSQALGYAYQDMGQFPDIPHQLVEIKLQTSNTIDLGLVLPSSVDPLLIAKSNGAQFKQCDVRFVIFHGVQNESRIELSHLIVVTGEKFFTRFKQFGGNIKNRKLQIHLPSDFFGV